MKTHNAYTTCKTKLWTGMMLSLLALPTLAMANSSEIEQLRQEVNQLKQLIQQMNVQQQQQSVTLQQAKTISQPVTGGLSSITPVTVSKNSAEVKLYGNVRMDGQYQVDGGNLSRLYNQISTVPLKGDHSTKDQLKSSLAATRLGVDFKSQSRLGEVAGKIEADFLGASDNLRLRHAYLTYQNWLIGQTWSNFAAPDYMPESIDALGYVGGSIKRNPQIRYNQKINPASQIIWALEDGKDDASNSSLPTLSARLNHQFSPDLKISARAMLTEKKTINDHETAWGVALGAKYDLFENTSIKADYYHVKGDSSFVSWANKGFLVNTENEIVATNKFDSITLGVTQKIKPNLRTTLGYGYMRSPDNQQYIAALSDPTSANKSLWQVWANIFYNPVQPISYGVEYVYGERTAFKDNAQGHDQGIDKRVNFVLMYDF